MADLTACFFCGTIEGPISPKTILPSALEDQGYEQYTVLVCPVCEEKLDRVLTPLLNHMNENNSVSGSPTPRTPEIDQPSTSANDSRQSISEEEKDRLSSQDKAAEPPTTSPSPDQVESMGTGNQPGSQSGQSRPESFPEGTKKLARLLQNREYPIERSAIEDLAVNAYEFDYEQSQAAIDALIDEGILIEDGTILKRSTEK